MIYGVMMRLNKPLAILYITKLLSVAFLIPHMILDFTPMPFDWSGVNPALLHLPMISLNSF